MLPPATLAKFSERFKKMLDTLGWVGNVGDGESDMSPEKARDLGEVGENIVGAGPSGEASKFSAGITKAIAAVKGSGVGIAAGGANKDSIVVIVRVIGGVLHKIKIRSTDV